MIFRESYIKKIAKFKDLDVIKVLVGIRRSGKSIILKQFQEYLQQNQIKSEQIISINFENPEYEILTYKQVYDLIKKRIKDNNKYYIFLDEVQNIKEFEKLIDGLYILENVDLYITGSNAYMLSGELATLLSGRYIEIKVFPLSFKEFLQNNQTNKDKEFEKYLKYGGFPYTTKINDDEVFQDYIQGIINTVLIKDVLSRKKRSDATIVYQLAKFLTDTIGNLITPKKIADTLTSNGIKTTNETVLSYLETFLDSLLFYKVDRYDIAGKKYLQINSKYYVVDSSFKQILVANKRQNKGFMLENIIFLELLRRGYQVYIGNINGLEVDFIATKNGITEYYQVALTMENDETFDREIKSLQSINDNYKKVLLSMDKEYFNEEGIEHFNIIDWLLNE